MLCPQMGYAETSTYLPFQEIRPRGPAWIISVGARSALQAAGLDLIMLNCLFVVCHGRCAGVAQMVSCSACMVQYIARLYICHCLYIMSHALPCKSSVQSGDSEQCMLAFIQLLSSNCTLTRSYYPLFVLILRCNLLHCAIYISSQCQMTCI